jgi:ParB-like chromosome segregation protein Spo0J
MATSSKAVDGIQEELAVRIEVTLIHLYERHPRRQLNPEYQRIKASIRTAGLDQPLVVTPKPDSADYVLQAGGNTRLQILSRLLKLHRIL